MDSEVDVDAHALPARPEIQEYVSPNQSSSSDDISTGTNSSLSEAAQQDLANERELVLPPLPSDEWPFGQMLVKIAKGISKDELEEIKEMFRGSDGIGKKVREKCDKCITLFGVLRENMYISPSDLLYLYKILYTLRRRDLLDIAVEYSRERHNVLHYFESSEMTEEGYETIKIHVEGPDFKKFKPESVERLRQVVAKIVCVPAEEIRLAGIEPGSSLLVILLLPEMYTTVLHDMLKRGRNLWELREIDVDVIHLRGQDFNLKGSVTIFEISY